MRGTERAPQGVWLRKAFLKEVQLTRSDWRECVSGPCISTPAVRSELTEVRSSKVAQQP